MVLYFPTWTCKYCNREITGNLWVLRLHEGKCDNKEQYHRSRFSQGWND